MRFSIGMLEPVEHPCLLVIGSIAQLPLELEQQLHLVFIHEDSLFRYRRTCLFLLLLLGRKGQTNNLDLLDRARIYSLGVSVHRKRGFFLFFGLFLPLFGGLRVHPAWTPSSTLDGLLERLSAALSIRCNAPDAPVLKPGNDRTVLFLGLLGSTGEAHDRRWLAAGQRIRRKALDRDDWRCLRCGRVVGAVPLKRVPGHRIPWWGSVGSIHVIA